MEADQLHSVCLKYQLGESSTSMGLAFAKAMEGDLFHTHIAVVDWIGMFIVPQISCEHNGVWQLDSSVPRLKHETAVMVYNSIKRQLRSEVKHGNFIRFNSCSPARVAKSFWHVHENQRLELYIPSLHGVPEY